MNPKAFVFLIIAILVTCFASAADPVGFDELSLLVRMNDSESSIMKEVTRRKLLSVLTPEQEATLRTQGAAESLLQSLRAPGLPVSETEAAAVAARREKEKKAQAEAALEPTPELAAAPAPIPDTTPVTNGNAVTPTGKHFVIDRIIIEKHPIPAPYFVQIQAQSGRSEATFFVPKKSYGSGGLTGSPIDIPLKIKLNDVQLLTSVNITLQLDTSEQNVTSYTPLAKHIARIQITEGSNAQTFVPAALNTPFIYRLYYHVE